MFHVAVHIKHFVRKEPKFIERCLEDNGFNVPKHVKISFKEFFSEFYKLVWRTFHHLVNWV